MSALNKNVLFVRGLPDLEVKDLEIKIRVYLIFLILKEKFSIFGYIEAITIKKDSKLQY